VATVTAVEEQTVLRAETVDTAAPAEAAGGTATSSRAVGRVLVAIALLVAWSLAYLFVLSDFSETRAQKGLYARLRSELAQGTAPIAEPVATGAPIALLDVPAAGIDHLVVVEGTASAQLQDGPGHLRSTALPGQTGISVLMGRSRSYGGVFSGVHALRPGDTITVTTGQGRFAYRVSDLPRASGVLKVPDTTRAMLTLVTSTGRGWLGGLESSSAIYVDAVLTGTPQLRTGTAAPPSDRELPMHGDASFGTLAALLLTVQLLGLVLAATAWARTHWSRLLAHVLGLPALLAALWLVSDIAARLLPNLM
jgi:sortase A